VIATLCSLNQRGISTEPSFVIGRGSTEIPSAKSSAIGGVAFESQRTLPIDNNPLSICESRSEMESVLQIRIDKSNLSETQSIAAKVSLETWL
jgi:hypothetical protein